MAMGQNPNFVAPVCSSQYPTTKIVILKWAVNSPNPHHGISHSGFEHMMRLRSSESWSSAPRPGSTQPSPGWDEGRGILFALFGLERMGTAEKDLQDVHEDAGSIP